MYWQHNWILHRVLLWVLNYENLYVRSTSGSQLGKKRQQTNKRLLITDKQTSRKGLCGCFATVSPTVQIDDKADCISIRDIVMWQNRRQI